MLLKYNELSCGESNVKVGSPKMKVFPIMCMKTNSRKIKQFEFAMMCMKLKDL